MDFKIYKDELDIPINSCKNYQQFLNLELVQRNFPNPFIIAVKNQNPSSLPTSLQKIL